MTDLIGIVVATFSYWQFTVLRDVIGIRDHLAS